MLIIITKPEQFSSNRSKRTERRIRDEMKPDSTHAQSTHHLVITSKIEAPTGRSPAVTSFPLFPSGVLSSEISASVPKRERLELEPSGRVGAPEGCFSAPRF